ncbi:MAG: carbohydrate kinase family protein [Candidatus Diapherotrites archaeon]
MSAKIIAIGDLNLDVLSTTGKMPELGEEAHIEKITYSIGGNAANFVVAAAKIGMRAELISAIGEDHVTQFLLGELKKNSVKGTLYKSRKINGCSLVFVNEKGRRRILSNKGALEDLGLKWVEEELCRKLNGKQLVYFGGWQHLLGLHNGFVPFLKRLKEKNCLIAFDVTFDEYGNWEKMLPLLKHIDLLFLNEIELLKLTTKKKMNDGLKALAKKGSGIIILKRGRNGAVVYTDKIIREPATKNRAKDSTGAGDVFNAAFLIAYLKNLPLKKCLRFGNWVAGEKVRHHGIVLPEKGKIKKFLKNLI